MKQNRTFSLARTQFWVLVFLLIILTVYSGYAQQNNSGSHVKSYEFKDGIYLSFAEFKSNNPSITNFKVIKKNPQFDSAVKLEYSCIDSIKGTIEKCEIQNCWGYVLNNGVFIAQGISGYYFRLHIIGSLIHYFAVEQEFVQFPDYSYGGTYSGYGQRTVSREYVIVAETGEKFMFNYSNFSEFLKSNDSELYQELEHTRKKKKMIYNFLLKYNEKHPFTFGKTG